jgi:hypothetical protein
VLIILACTFLEVIGCSFTVASLYHQFLNMDHYMVPLQNLPEFLEAALLLVPSVLPRLGRGPPEGERTDRPNGMYQLQGEPFCAA